MNGESRYTCANLDTFHRLTFRNHYSDNLVPWGGGQWHPRIKTLADQDIGKGDAYGFVSDYDLVRPALRHGSIH
jgi:hypothetical protein